MVDEKLNIGRLVALRGSTHNIDSEEERLYNKSHWHKSDERSSGELVRRRLDNDAS